MHGWTLVLRFRDENKEILDEETVDEEVFWLNYLTATALTALRALGLLADTKIAAIVHSMFSAIVRSFEF